MTPERVLGLLILGCVAVIVVAGAAYVLLHWPGVGIGL